MITDFEIADLCTRIYAEVGEPPVEWDFFEAGLGDHGVCFGIIRLGDIDYVIFRGSKVFLDWRRDTDWWSRPRIDARLGPVWPGFVDAMPEAWQEIKTRISDRVVIGGHSLGAARTSPLAALMKLDGIKPLARVVFGEPYPGMQPLANLIADIPSRSYRNGDPHHHDVVTDVPYPLPLLNWVHPSPLIHVTAAPTQQATDLLGRLFNWHHCPLYRQAMKNMVPAGAD